MHKQFVNFTTFLRMLFSFISDFFCSNSGTKFKCLFNDDHRLICGFFNVNKATAYRWINAGQPTNNTALRLLDIAAIYSVAELSRPFDVLPNETDVMCEQLGRVPSADKQMSQPRLFKPWRDREPDFVKEFNKTRSSVKSG
ncbi:hypothetical protein HQQ94_12690 [Shewanella sp. VB17]|uniref:hypothetical protein n=1 Tax=Shewanella sp. VB17 TaxID=2739432 RepID=UPI001563657F|nr:hypothetical protein [Shewanella sp. VB17]NRD74077.1 hypothetical protein [Shewanella sp. VB17]